MTTHHTKSPNQSAKTRSRNHMAHKCTTTQKLGRIHNTLLDQNDTRIQREFQKFRKCKSSSSELESTNSHYLHKFLCFSAAGIFHLTIGHPLYPLTATSSDHRGTLVHRRPTWQNRHADKTNRSTTSKQSSKHAEEPQKRSSSWRRFPKTVPGVQKSPKPWNQCRQWQLNIIWTTWNEQDGTASVS